jgi:hypothetical protein
MEVLEIMEESRNKQWVLPSLNATFLTLIPKEENEVAPSKYKPIALCNVIYKIITKVIANRLKPLLPLLISPEKTGYVEGRKIIDGIILSHEVIHTLKHQETGHASQVGSLQRFQSPKLGVHRKYPPCLWLQLGLGTMDPLSPIHNLFFMS